MSYLDQVFGPDGFLAKRFDSYQPRRGQIELATAVDRALSEGLHLVGEGPCGTGKGIAYGVPAVYYAAEGAAQVVQPDPFGEGGDAPEDNPNRVVIATANIALQEQLIRKDLPLLQSVLPWRFSFALLKGRYRYVCRHRFDESVEVGKLPGSGLFDHHGGWPERLVQLTKWARETDTGDESDAPFLPDREHWGLMAVTGEECLGPGCNYRDKCFSEEARSQAREADIVVTNFHVLLSDVMAAIRGIDGRSLPPHRFLIIDEAHELPDVAREFLGFSRGVFAFKQMSNQAKKWGRGDIAVDLLTAAEQFFASVAALGRSQLYQTQRRLKTGDLIEWGAPYERLLAESREFAKVADEWANMEGPRKDRATGSMYLSKARKAIDDIEAAVDCTDDGRVFFIELDPKKGDAKLCSRVIDVGPALSSHLFSSNDATVMVSATITTSGNFSFHKRETGLGLLGDDAIIECIADSPFDFDNQALLVVPDNMPDPKSPEFSSAAADVFERIIKYFDGRTLGLFTSYKSLKSVSERLNRTGRTVLIQGEKARTELARIFRDDERSVLLGTSSFWTGIDVPGDSLSAVVIDKLPFPTPDNPVVAAICDKDPDSFKTYMIPKAAIMLRQGVGRLIRDRHDIGVVVILDPRIAEKFYGKMFKRSLPPMRVTRDLDNIAVFMEEAREWRVSQGYMSPETKQSLDSNNSIDFQKALDRKKELEKREQQYVDSLQVASYHNQVYTVNGLSPINDDDIPF